MRKDHRYKVVIISVIAILGLTLALLIWYSNKRDSHRKLLEEIAKKTIKKIKFSRT